MRYWFNVVTGEVEQNEETSRKAYLLGPYDTREEAQQALDTARKRTEAWDEEDRRWKEGEDES